MAPVLLSSRIPNGIRPCVLVVTISLLAVMIAAGCSRSEPIESAAQVTDGNATQRSAGAAPEVIATTSGGPAEREATTGVASTTQQTEASASGGGGFGDIGFGDSGGPNTAGLQDYSCGPQRGAFRSRPAG